MTLVVEILNSPFLVSNMDSKLSSNKAIPNFSIELTNYIIFKARSNF